MPTMRLELKGLAELRETLKQLPEAFASEAAGYVDDQADAAARDIISQDPEVTGNLKGHVVVKKLASRGRYGVVRQVRSTARHAHLYEYGTAARQTALGYNRGFMPGIPTVVPTVIRHRRQLVGRLIDVVRRAGFEIRGGAD